MATLYLGERRRPESVAAVEIEEWPVPMPLHLCQTDQNRILVLLEAPPYWGLRVTAIQRHLDIPIWRVRCAIRALMDDGLVERQHGGQNRWVYIATKVKGKL